MLRVYHSNRLDVLEALMEFIVERQRLDDPFQAEMVLVQSTGMAQWLQMTPGRALWDCRQYRVPAAGELYLGYVRARPERYSGRKRLQQAEHELEADDPPAAAPSEEDDFILLRQYLSDDGDKRKLFQLAARVADPL